MVAYSRSYAAIAARTAGENSSGPIASDLIGEGVHGQPVEGLQVVMDGHAVAPEETTEKRMRAVMSAVVPTATDNGLRRNGPRGDQGLRGEFRAAGEHRAVKAGRGLAMVDSSKGSAALDRGPDRSG